MNAKGKLCIIRMNYFPEESHLLRNVNALKESGWNVTIICLGDKKNQLKHEILDGVNVYRIFIERKRTGVLRYLFEYLYFSISVFFKLNIRLIKENFKYLEVDNMPDFLVFSTIIQKIRGSFVVMYMFENMPELFATDKNLSVNNPFIKVLKFIENCALRYADRIIAVHNESKKLFLNKKINGDKFTTVLNVPESIKLPPQNDKANNDFILLSHGSILKRYGYDVSIKAFKYVSDKYNNIKYFIIGDGEYKDELKSLAKKLELQQKVKFIDKVKFEQLFYYIQRADIGIIPMYINYQMLPNKLFEYIYCGLPIIITDIPVLRYYFDENTLIFFKNNDEKDLAEKIIEIYENPEKLRKLSDNLKKSSPRFKWENIKNDYTSVFNR